MTDSKIQNPEIDEDFKEKIELFNSLSKNHLGKTLDISLTRVTKDVVAATMPVTDKVHQPFGILHGGVSLVLAETVASVAAWLHVDHTKYNVVGVEINANHLRQVRKGNITAEATPIKIGKKLQVWGIDIYNDDGEKTCSSRCTLLAVNK